MRGQPDPTTNYIRFPYTTLVRSQPLDARHAEGEGEIAQPGREQRRIERIGIAIGRAQAVVFGGRGEAVRLRSRDGERIVADRPRHAACRQPEPIMMEGDARELSAEGTDRMDIAFADEIGTRSGRERVSQSV